jgi:ribulose-phosphate 3-epimerase
MKVHIGLKSDPIEYRYSFDWLFGLMAELGVRHLQLGSFQELHGLEAGFFRDLRRRAERKGVVIRSCFTAHRELGGFFSGDPFLERAARRCYERYIEAAALLGAESVGGNPGSVYRDRMAGKPEGIACYLRHMGELVRLARRRGLRFLALEPMSCLAEPPTLPEEIEGMLGALNEHHRLHPDAAVPVYACADIAHGYADREGRVVYDNWSLFERAIPWMGELHLKNTDARFESTFGFSAVERKRGIVDLGRLKALIERNAPRFPVGELVGYLELGGPKLGRDYSDHRLAEAIGESIAALREAFP